MGTNINGWVEGQLHGSDEDDEWYAVINIGLVLGRSYETFGRLFGVRVYEDADYVPVAPKRGIPANASLAIQDETKLPDGWETQRYLDGLVCCQSATWLGWSEIVALNWSEFENDVQTLFRLMQVLSESNLYADVRLVVWFDN